MWDKIRQFRIRNEIRSLKRTALIGNLLWEQQVGVSNSLAADPAWCVAISKFRALHGYQNPVKSGPGRVAGLLRGALK